MNLSGFRADLEIAELAASGLFDQEWYAAVNTDLPAAGMDPLLHWYSFGCGEARNPSRYFDTKWYMTQNPDVVAAAMNPLIHYQRHGDIEGRRPMPYFDPGWYRASYGIPHDQLALRHFLIHRDTGKFAPCPEFYSLTHQSTTQDGFLKGRDVFAFALEQAEREGFEPHPDADLVAASGLLDINYYLINGTDVHESELDAPQHFCRFGWREGRKPNIYFDINWYLYTNPNVVTRRLNPLVHYLLEGECAGRRPVAYFDPIWYRETYRLDASETALAHYLANRRSQKYSPNQFFDVNWYVRHSGVQVGRNRDPFAHYLQIGTFEDVSPSPAFNAPEYRRTHLGRPSRFFRHLINPEKHNPLVHYLQANYR